MKKAVILLTTMSLLLVGCSSSGDSADTSATDDSSSETTETTDTAETEEPAEEGASIADRAAELIKTRNIRVVIGSTSTGGDTYAMSAAVAKELENVLGKNVKVDPTGTAGAYEAISQSSDGSTIMIFHDGAYFGKLFEVDGYPDIFTDEITIGPTLGFNPGNAYTVSKDYKYNSVQEVIDAVVGGETVRFAIQPGSASEIGYHAMRYNIKEAGGDPELLVAVPSGAQSDKNEKLFQGLADIIHSSVQAAAQFTALEEDDQQAQKFLWITADSEILSETNEEGYEGVTRDDMLEYAYPNVVLKTPSGEDFTYSKTFFTMYNGDMSQEIVDLYDDAMAEVFANEAFIEDLKNQFFVPYYNPSSEAEVILEDLNTQYGELINSMK